MYERFTDRARKVMQLANQEAQRFNHEYIGTEHILLGLVKEGSGVAANVLKNLDVDLRKIRLEVEKLVQCGFDNVPVGKLPQTPRAKKVIEYAMAEARNLGHTYVGTEHLLLGMLREGEAVAAQVLMNLGLRLENVRAEVLATLRRAEDEGNGAYSPQSRIRWATPTDPATLERPPRSKWSSCLVMGLGAVVFVVLGVLGRGWSLQRQQERESKDRWDRQIAEVEAGKTTRIVWPEPRFLEGFVRDQPEVAAEITQVIFSVGRVSDERFGYLKQFPHLKAIAFDEVWEGADSFLERIAGMESITSLSFYQTGVTEEGVRAVASLPNLKRLRIDYFWKQTSLEPLRSYKGIETIALDLVTPKKEWIELMATLPNLRELELEEDEPISDSVLLNLQRALPKVKILHGK